MNSRLFFALPLVLAFLAPAAAQDHGREQNGLPWLEEQRWVTALRHAADDQVTYEICAWGRIDLRTARLGQAEIAGASRSQLNRLAAAFDTAETLRRAVETALTLQPWDDTPFRYHGLYPNAGCNPAVRARIDATLIR